MSHIKISNPPPPKVPPHITFVVYVILMLQVLTLLYLIYGQ